MLEPLSGYLALGAALCTEGAEYAGAWNFGPLLQNTYTVRQLVEEIIKPNTCGRLAVDFEMDPGKDIRFS